MSIRLCMLLVTSFALHTAACSRMHEADMENPRGSAAQPGAASGPGDDTARASADDDSETSRPPTPRSAGQNMPGLDRPLDPGTINLGEPEADDPVPGEERDPGDEWYATSWEGGPCASVVRSIHTSPMHFAFLLDGSSRMGRSDVAWHDKKLKWDAVVAALRLFFERGDARNVSASITLFPGDGSRDQSCSAQPYQEPDVPMIALPSAAPSMLLDDVAPRLSADFREGAPLSAALQGTRDFLTAYKQTHAGGFAIVLLTDDEVTPGCGMEDDAATAASKPMIGASGLDIPTYVIALKDPSDAATRSSAEGLGAIAGSATHHARLVDIGDPARTTTQLTTALAEVRAHASSCTFPLPIFSLAFPRSSQTVRITAGAARTALEYDPTCTLPNAWDFEKSGERQQIVPCAQTCKALQAEAEDSLLRVDFACIHPILI